jgi:hypothetical protein
MAATAGVAAARASRVAAAPGRDRDVLHRRGGDVVLGRGRGWGWYENVFHGRDRDVFRGRHGGILHGRGRGRVGRFAVARVVARCVRSVVEQSRSTATQGKSKEGHRAEAPHVVTMAAARHIRQMGQRFVKWDSVSRPLFGRAGRETATGSMTVSVDQGLPRSVVDDAGRLQTAVALECLDAAGHRVAARLGIVEVA